MTLDVVRGRISNISATKELINALENQSTKECNETLYLGYPLSADAEASITVDALFLSQKYGIVAFIFSNCVDESAIINEQGELYYQITNTLTKYPKLRKGRSLAFEPQVVSISTRVVSENIEDGYIISTLENISDTISSLSPFDESYYRLLVESLQKIASIKPRKKRDHVEKTGSKGDVIKKIELEIANLDQWQKKAALETVDGPQRIRGLAGSGKTIVLALKAAYLHAQNPGWDIAITYYSRSLYQQYRELITRFVFEFSRDEPNWDKLHLFHAWGSQSEPGLYSEVARSINHFPVNFANAKIKFGTANAFSGICNELNQLLANKNCPLYDILLIDEAQDLPASFFKIAYKCISEQKRIVWAYDELQNLNSSTMPSIDEMFGLDAEDKFLVELKNEPNEPMQDIILPVCYRNPPWALTLAHSLGFGIYRKQLVQHFEALELWKDIGYKVDKGDLDFGKQVVLSRKQDSTPNYFDTLLAPDDVINSQIYDNVDLQYDSIASQISINITDDELDPDDILIIFPSVICAKSQYQNFVKHLARYSISSTLAGVTHDRDTFRIPGSVTCSTIYRAKGNEAPMVYLLNSEYCHEGLELITLRNTLFTAITRSRAWIRIVGVGPEMKSLISEIEKFINKKYVLDFKIPTKSQMGKLRIINRERNAFETKKFEEARKGVQTLLDLVNKGEIDQSQIPEFSSLMKLFLNNKSGSDEIGED